MSAVTDAIRYDGYGLTIDADGTFGSPWKYQGALDLAPNANPLYDLRARNYAPSLAPSRLSTRCWAAPPTPCR
jgi:hypothetical protein